MAFSPRRAALVLLTVSGGLAGCDSLDLDQFNPIGGSKSSGQQVAQTLPPPDSRGVISFPTYQIVKARGGETLADIAKRLDQDLEKLVNQNGLPPDVGLPAGQIVILPNPVPLEDGTDVAGLANSALGAAGTDAAANAGASAVAVAPVKHVVARGETAYSISRLYDVPVRSLADMNNLPADFSIREGQTLLIPTKLPNSAPSQQIAAPGTGSQAPEPPSAARPQPAQNLPSSAVASSVATATLETPQTSASDTGRLAKPVEGRIIRAYEKGKNDGVDFGASAGAAVKAADAGTVAAITNDVDQVPIILVRHANNLLTVYANVDGIKVAKGEKVQRGQVLASVRASEPSFLHFEVRRGFESVDPVPLLTQ
ncbi:MAG: LysM peptidoglycan-binding domain-containing protein [Mangrovicoccus sp.]